MMFNDEQKKAVAGMIVKSMFDGINDIEKKVVAYIERRLHLMVAAQLGVRSHHNERSLTGIDSTLTKLIQRHAKDAVDQIDDEVLFASLKLYLERTFEDARFKETVTRMYDSTFKQELKLRLSRREDVLASIFERLVDDAVKDTKLALEGASVEMVKSYANMTGQKNDR